jgi:hypothetical protein
MKKFSGVFAKFRGSNDFWDLWNYFPYNKSIDYVHSTVDQISFADSRAYGLH